MQMRKLGNSDLLITPVGYGAWAIGGSGWQFAWGSQDDNESISAIRRALELGVNWIDIAAVTSLQPRYSLVHREIEDEILPYCLEQHIGVIVYSPMASGLLTGAMTRERAARLPQDDWRKGHLDFTEPNLSRNLALVERLREIGHRHNRSVGEVAIAWTLHHPAV